MTFKEYALQDGNTLEATQTMIESRAVTEFPLNDQEILLRHLHKTNRGYVAEYQRSDGGGTRPCRVPERGVPMTDVLPPAFADLERFAAWCLPTEAERYAKRLASPMDELQAFYDAAFPRLEEILAYLDSFDLDSLPDDAGPSPAADLLPGQRVVPGRGVAAGPGAGQRRGQHGRRCRAVRSERHPVRPLTKGGHRCASA